MFKTRVFARTVLLAGAVPLLLASSAIAQERDYGRSSDQDNRAFANRMVEGTVASVVADRNGARVRFTTGVELWVPNSITTMNQGRRYQASMLQPGDVVRLGVFSREEDGRDGRVRSIELLRLGRDGYGRDGYNNDRRFDGTVVSFDRRDNILILQTDSGRTINVDVQNFDGRLHRGDRVFVSGRMDRDRGTFIAERVRINER